MSTVLLGATMSALDVSIVSVALPTLKTTFGVSMAVVEWVSMAYMLALTIFLPLFGRLADLFGRSKLYNLGFGIFSVGSLLCGISSSAVFLIAARIIQAIGAGLLQANSVALITQAFPRHERGKAIGVQGAVQAIAMAIGPFVGGVLIASVGWRAIFYVNIPIGILGTIAGLLILPPKREVMKKEKIDYLGAALFASGLASIVLAFNEGVKLGWSSHAILMYFASGIVLMTAFVITELKVEYPLIDLKLFRNPTFALGNLTGMMSYYVLFAVMFMLPFYLEKVLGYSIVLTGSLLTPLLLAMAAVAPLSGHISDKYGPRIMTTSGMMLSALACLALLLAGPSVQLPLLLVIVILLGMGLGLFTPSNNSAIMSAAPVEKLGMAGGLLNMTRSMGLILGVDISGGIFTMLEHRYLAANGYANVQHVFSDTSIPLPVKDGAFMHGFIVVMVVLLAVNVLSAFLSAARSGERYAIIDHEMAGGVVVSSGFFSGFDQEAKGIALLTMLLLCTGVFGALASSRLINETSFLPQASPICAPGQVQALANAKKQALAYYAGKYHDADVQVKVASRGDHMEADVSKNGMLVDRLSIRGKNITEHRTGVGAWIFYLLSNV
ncbi:MAG: MFS transporter [Desulfobacteraceae bacterium]|nr:MFS transporter [Desulfobacteraceae bacterium]